MRAELDYRREARNADRFRASFADEKIVYVPRVHWDHSTRRVLVMERIRGIKIDDILALDAAGLDRHQIALNAATMVVKEVLEDGFFHADPHPGNFLVLPEEVIGLMDYGMVGFVDNRMRLDLIRLYVSAIGFDTEGVVDQLVRMGAAEEDIHRRALASDIGRMLNKYRGVPLKDIRAGDVIADLMPIAFRHQLHLPTDLWLLAKTFQMMEGVGLQLDPGFDIFENLRASRPPAVLASHPARPRHLAPVRPALGHGVGRRRRPLAARPAACYSRPNVGNSSRSISRSPPSSWQSWISW